MSEERTRRAITGVALTLLALGAVACGSNRDAPRTGTPGDTAIAYSLPESVRAHDTTALDSGAVPGAVPDSAMAESGVVLRTDSAAGALIFHRTGRCFTCHGRDGAGLEGLGSNLRDSTWSNTGGRLSGIISVIRDGILPGGATAPMPAFGSQLSPEAIQQVAAYVYAISHPDSVVADTTAADSLSADSARADTLNPFAVPTPAMLPPSSAPAIPAVSAPGSSAPGGRDSARDGARHVRAQRTG
ncbi:MAG TPA: c-type cytochrome [Gemmatimonadaceae bacterium]|nr:c-type cytochrome [Gemmatimonadaceae bacterium]